MKKMYKISLVLGRIDCKRRRETMHGERRDTE